MVRKSGNKRVSTVRHECEPPHSKLFVLNCKRSSEEEIREEFGRFGNIEYVKILVDTKSQERKGPVYVKFEKTSQAAQALESLDGRKMKGERASLRVIVSQNTSKDQGREVKGNRLSLKVNKDMTENDLAYLFKPFGTLKNVTILRDDHGNSRELAFVIFSKFSEAAIAFENCDPKFMPRFSDLKRGQEWIENEACNGNQFTMAGSRSADRAMNSNTRPSLIGTPAWSLRAKIHPSLSLPQVWKLFNLVPDLVNCQLAEITPDGGVARITYSSQLSAEFALERLNGFEYPLGSSIEVEAELTGDGISLINSPATVKSETSTVQRVTDSLLTNVSGQTFRPFSDRVGHAFKPDPPAMKPGSAADSRGANERLFFVLKNSRELPTSSMMYDLFNQFGNLINCNVVPGKRFGYAVYADEESASTAVKMLDKTTVLEGQLVVMVADPNHQSAKRPRMDADKQWSQQPSHFSTNY